jgi:hypothetical protein
LATGPGALPPELDPRHWRQTGAQVLEGGPPELPSRLTHQMWIPLCCWAGQCCGVVAFMYFAPDHEDGHMRPVTTLVPYTREDGRWVAPQGNSFYGYSNNDGFDPLSDPDDRRHLDGSTMTYGRFSPRGSHQPGRPASTAVGHVSPEVRYLAVIQDGQQDYRALHSHFGTYLVCVEKPGPFDVAAFDSDGKLLDVHQYPHPMHRLHRRRSADT